MRMTKSASNDDITVTDMLQETKTSKKKNTGSKKKMIARDISWLSFNGRVLQEAADKTVPLRERIRFLGIFSNNLDEFFRVRVATLRRMQAFGKSARVHLEQNPEAILEDIQHIVIEQQREFDRIWKDITEELQEQHIFIRTEKQLNKEQQRFILNYFNEEVRTNIIPLMIESIQHFPYLRDKSIYLAVVLARQDNSVRQKFSLIEIPTAILPRFIILPSKEEEHEIILLEDVIRFCLPHIFSYFGYDKFSAHIVKVTRDAELDIDNDVATSLIHQIEKGLKARRKGKPVRFLYDKDIDPLLLEYLMRRQGLSGKDNIIPGARIHNFKDFMDFPASVFTRQQIQHRKTFIHPLFVNATSVMHVIQQQDVLLNLPYHSFDSIIDLLREAAIDPNVTSIKITAYRLARNSKIVNALINAVRNGKQVTVVIELRARFNEADNLDWKSRLEEEGVKVLIGIPNMKVHAKLCVIKKRIGTKTVQCGFISTGNLNEKTAHIYGDHCLLTANRNVMADINRIFSYLESPRHDIKFLQDCKLLPVSPYNMRGHFIRLIDKEIKNAQHKKHAAITVKLNSLSDAELISRLYEAARVGVNVKLIIRGICCAYTENKKWKKNISAVSIVDEYLEHARVFIFHNGGQEKVFISSCDWMVRNLDHRVECALPILDPHIKQELIDIIKIQLSGNVKARILDNEQKNEYKREGDKKVRSQIEIYKYLHEKQYPQ
ncbi:polyphosphate kinase 1 [Chitinophaga pendula]|uniref:polyphosphate kinase 1 n=1 Tax=Chitinophaga TaxID=79328 RepID=UPI000BAEE8F5|nr:MULTISPECIES: polyphosphate kinase 1 [Chitinophaga]ASZ13180.1 polyphosphate kinase 1 [Chitinophaga sp. MD30]UCJ09198.1 polyphosphate kinase 1 [Chitinophaga pendula]